MKRPFQCVYVVSEVYFHDRECTVPKKDRASYRCAMENGGSGLLRLQISNVDIVLGRTLDRAIAKWQTSKNGYGRKINNGLTNYDLDNRKELVLPVRPLDCAPIQDRTDNADVMRLKRRYTLAVACHANLSDDFVDYGRANPAICVPLKPRHPRPTLQASKMSIISDGHPQGRNCPGHKKAFEHLPVHQPTHADFLMKKVDETKVDSEYLPMHLHPMMKNRPKSMSAFMPLEEEGRTILTPAGVGFPLKQIRHHIKYGEIMLVGGSTYHCGEVFHPGAKAIRNETDETEDTYPMHKLCLFMYVESKFWEHTPNAIEMCVDASHTRPEHLDMFSLRGKQRWAMMALDSCTSQISAIASGNSDAKHRARNHLRTAMDEWEESNLKVWGDVFTAKQNAFDRNQGPDPLAPSDIEEEEEAEVLEHSEPEETSRSGSSVAAAGSNEDDGGSGTSSSSDGVEGYQPPSARGKPKRTRPPAKDSDKKPAAKKSKTRKGSSS